MAVEMSAELLEAMQGLDAKHWEEITQMWLKGEAEKGKYNDQYYTQLNNLNLSNRTFREEKRMLTPEEKSIEIDQNILEEIKNRKELEKQHTKEINQDDLIDKFADVKQSMFSFNRLKKTIDATPLNKEKVEKDRDDFE